MLASISKPDSAHNSPAWQTLAGMAEHYQHNFDLRTAFAEDPERFNRFSLRAPHLLADLSKNLWDERVFEKLLALAESSGLINRREKLLNGGIVNDTEQQPALHAALRRAFISGRVNGPGMAEHYQEMLTMLALAEDVRNDSRIHDVVHIGIGGSGLGPELAVQALQPYKSTRQRLHFVSNMDGHDLHQTLQACEPQHTLFVVASKSWGTAETLRNAQSALQWFSQHGGQQPVSHFVAITGKAELARAMGMGRVLHLPEGIGGRFSLWSAVGLPLAIAIGAAGFKAMLQGAAAMDDHFEQAPLQANLPVWLGLLDVWTSTFLHLSSRCVAPYHHGLRRLPAYLQQLEMESNGKRVRADGTSVNYPTAAALWGEVGSNSQHAFFQWLHQGTQRVPLEIIVTKQPAHPLEGHQDPLIANALAQAQALMMGSAARSGQLPGHQDFPGNRPSSFVVLDDLSPASLGSLLALQEHRVFVSGTIWGINSFDQWGVELGKNLATDLHQRLHTGEVKGLDPSTAGLLTELRAKMTGKTQQGATP